MLDINVGVTGHYTLHKGKMNSDGEVLNRVFVAEFPNLILDTGLHRIGQNADWMNWLHLGTGNITPSVNQNSLQNPIYVGNTLAPSPHTDAGVNIENPLKPFSWVRRVFRVTPRGVNRTYGEMGVGWNDLNLFSRSLIKDPQGNPNTITILGDEYLDVTYVVRMYIPVSSRTITVVPTGDDTETRTITARAAHINKISPSDGWGLAPLQSGNNYYPQSILGVYSTNHHYAIFDGIMGGLYAGPEGNQVGSRFNATSIVRTSDTSAEITLTRELADNVGTIRSIVLSQTAFCYQIQIDPPFHKTNEERFSISYNISWQRGEG